MNSTAKSGLDFQDLARGGERNYSCSFLVNLDSDLLALANPQRSFLGLAEEVLPAPISASAPISKSFLKAFNPDIPFH